jgi:hypothetical protein
MPPCLQFESDNLFVKLLQALRCGDTNTMLRIIRSTLRDLTAERRDLFPLGEDTPLFVVINEAQAAAEGFCCSGSGDTPCLVLHEMHNFFQTSGIFAGIILSGTGLSMKMEKDVVRSSAKRVNQRMNP